MSEVTCWYLRSDMSQTAVIVGTRTRGRIQLIKFTCSDGSFGEMDRKTFQEHYTAFPDGK